jgi:hypothetical protein
MILDGCIRIGETFTYTVTGYDDFCWNVSRARWEVLEGHVDFVAELPREQMLYIFEHNDFQETHLHRIDVTKPGIAVPLKSPPEYGGHVAHILIDGTHRCVQALRTGRPFSAHILTAEAAARCLLHGDDRLKVTP